MIFVLVVWQQIASDVRLSDFVGHVAIAFIIVNVSLNKKWVISAIAVKKRAVFVAQVCTTVIGA